MAPTYENIILRFSVFFVLLAIVRFGQIEAFQRPVNFHPRETGKLENMKQNSNQRFLRHDVFLSASVPGSKQQDIFTQIQNTFSGMFNPAKAEPTPKLEPIKTQVGIVGAGVSGLVCAKELVKQGVDVKVFEASDGVGGRVRTDKVDGYLLDRGFQVFIEPYPEVQKQLNYEKLNLRQFQPGALVYYDGKLSKVADPFRQPQDTLAALLAPVGDIFDKIKVGIMRITIIFRSDEDIFKSAEMDTLSYLRNNWGFSDDMISKFFRPFYEGIYLAPLNKQSSRMFDFVFKMFAQGAASLPAEGIGKVATCLAEELPEGTIQFESEVQSVEKGKLLLKNGQEVVCDAVVVAADPQIARKLLNEQIEIPEARASTCLYFGVDGEAPVKGPVLVLNGEQTTPELPVNNVVFLEQCAPEYAPEGKSLASVTVVGNPAMSDEILIKNVTAHLAKMFGEQAREWKLLKIYRIPYAQPAQTPPNEVFEKDPMVSDGVYCCGDHRGTSTLNGAFESGVKVASTVTQALAAGESSQK